MLLLIVTTIVTAMGLARERESGTLEQVLVTPIRPIWLLLGKLLPFLVIGIVDVALLLAVGTWLFDVPLRGSFLVGLLGVVLYLFSTLGMGLLISTLSQTQQQAFLGGFLFVMPAILLSGVMTPIRAMPGWLQAITLVNPLRHFAEVIRGVLLRGAGLGELWFQLAMLVVIGGAVMSVPAFATTASFFWSQRSFSGCMFGCPAHWPILPTRAVEHCYAFFYCIITLRRKEGPAGLSENHSQESSAPGITLMN